MRAVATITETDGSKRRETALGQWTHLVLSSRRQRIRDFHDNSAI